MIATSGQWPFITLLSVFSTHVTTQLYIYVCGCKNAGDEACARQVAIGQSLGLSTSTMRTIVSPPWIPSWRSLQFPRRINHSLVYPPGSSSYASSDWMQWRVQDFFLFFYFYNVNTYHEKWLFLFIKCFNTFIML